MFTYVYTLTIISDFRTPTYTLHNLTKHEYKPRYEIKTYTIMYQITRM